MVTEDYSAWTIIQHHLHNTILIILSSVLWRCWLGIRKSIRPVKNVSDVVLAWLSVWCKVQSAYDPS